MTENVIDTVANLFTTPAASIRVIFFKSDKAFKYPVAAFYYLYLKIHIVLENIKASLFHLRYK